MCDRSSLTRICNMPMRCSNRLVKLVRFSGGQREMYVTLPYTRDSISILTNPTNLTNLTINQSTSGRMAGQLVVKSESETDQPDQKEEDARNAEGGS